MKRISMVLFSVALTSSLFASQPALTIYNQNFAVVRDTVPVELKQGVNNVRFTETTAHLEPDSVILRDPTGKTNLQILEQNYRNDPVSQELLLSLFEGKTIDFLVVEPNKPNTIVHGKIVRSGYARHSQEAMQRYGQRYAMAQSAMAYQRGKTFENAKIKLMAGDVSKIQQAEVAGYARNEELAVSAAMPPPVSEKAFEDYHLYTLARPATLRDRETKQVEFIRANGVKSERIYVYDGLKIDWNQWRGYRMENLRNNQDLGMEMETKDAVMREFKNSEANHLGMPLPKGRVRFYKQDDDKQLEFTGENLIDHTPRDETLRVFTGNAFDLVGERRRTNVKADSSNHWLDETFEIKLRNHKKEPVEIRVVEHLFRWTNWNITEKSDPFTKTNAQTIEFRIPVKADEEKTIHYTVHYSW